MHCNLCRMIIWPTAATGRRRSQCRGVGVAVIAKSAIFALVNGVVTIVIIFSVKKGCITCLLVKLLVVAYY
jgi:hypothetical protein